MPRYLVEREFPDGLDIPMNEAGADACRKVIERNAEYGVTWVHSYATTDRKRTFCITTRPRRRRSAAPQPVTSCRSSRSPKVRVLDPYFYFV
jgi:hypothetical protein